jgi:uncharacterized protein (DUF1684 family)
MSARDLLELLDWKRRVAELYRRAREDEDPEAGWLTWREGRDALFQSHPASPIPRAERDRYAGIPMFDYDPTLRLEPETVEAEHTTLDIAGSHDTFRFTRVATLRFELGVEALRLDLYWLEGYGGGLFLPFRDATSGRTTYGAGRYLLDTVKGADLGSHDARLVIDLNFAYNPSCAYDPAWACPLAPPANRLPVAVEAGERLPADAPPRDPIIPGSGRAS